MRFQLIHLIVSLALAGFAACRQLPVTHFNNAAVVLAPTIAVDEE